MGGVGEVWDFYACVTIKFNQCGRKAETVANMNIRPRNIASAISNTVRELQVYKYTFKLKLDVSQV